ncbi:MAG: CoA ester lyase [Sphingopyxis granuli]
MRLPFKPRRTALYLPAINARAVAKARTLPVDIVILDLEDAVAPERKEEARNAAVAAAQEGGFGDRELIIRANGLDTPWWRDDLVAAARSGADGVLMPKVGSAADIARCGELLRDAPAGLSLWAMIETCAAVVALPAIAAAAEGSRLAAMVLGTNDLAKEMRAALTPDRLAFLPILTSTVIAARAHGLIVLDGVCNDFQDIDRFEAECRQGLVLGFDGKTIIHPRQVDPCNAVYSPTRDEVRWAERIITAFDAPDHAGKGVVQIDGQMVERLHLEDARRVQATAAAIARRRDESVD